MQTRIVVCPNGHEFNAEIHGTQTRYLFWFAGPNETAPRYHRYCPEAGCNKKLRQKLVPGDGDTKETVTN